MILMTKDEALALAKIERDYVAKKIRNTGGRFWGVWCVTSDHWVEFDQSTIDRIYIAETLAKITS